jgi:hypothetical protein
VRVVVLPPKQDLSFLLDIPKQKFVVDFDKDIVGLVVYNWKFMEHNGIELNGLRGISNQTEFERLICGFKVHRRITDLATNVTRSSEIYSCLR